AVLPPLVLLVGAVALLLARIRAALAVLVLALAGAFAILVLARALALFAGLVAGLLAVGCGGAGLAATLARRVALDRHLAGLQFRRPGPVDVDERILGAGPRHQCPQHEQDQDQRDARGQPDTGHRPGHLQPFLP